MLKLNNYERETIITYNEAEATANVYTHNASLLRKLDGWATERPEDCVLTSRSHDGQAADYTVPKSWIKVRPPRKASDAQLEALAKARAKQAGFTSETPAGADD